MMFSFFRENNLLCLRIMVHLNFVLILADLVWYVLYTSVWSDQHNSYFSKLATIHTFIKVFALLECILKVILLGITLFLFRSSKQENKNLFDFSYISDLDGYKASQDKPVVENMKPPKVNK